MPTDRVWFAEGALQSTPGTGVATISSAGGRNYDGNPHLPLVYRVRGLSGRYDGNPLRFVLQLDSGRSVGNGTQLRLSWDFDGDGTTDRVETWRYFATNDLPGWESYREGAGRRSLTGAWRDLSRGSVTAEVWNAIGTGPTQLRVDSASYLQLPFLDLRLE